MTVLLPDWVQRNMMRERVESSADPAVIKYWNRRLKHDLSDEGLSLAWAGENATGPGIVPGRWHIKRRHPGVADTYFAVTTPDGGFREMSDAVVQQFRAGDLWNTQVRADRDRAIVRAQKSEERAKETAKEQRVDEIKSNLNALERPSVLFSDTRWTNRPSGKRGKAA